MSDKVNEIQGRLAEVREYVEGLEHVDRDRRRLLAIIDAPMSMTDNKNHGLIAELRRIHRPIKEGENEGFCVACDRVYPCQTVRTLDVFAAHLGGSQ